MGHLAEQAALLEDGEELPQVVVRHMIQCPLGSTLRSGSCTRALRSCQKLLLNAVFVASGTARSDHDASGADLAYHTKALTGDNGDIPLSARRTVHCWNLPRSLRSGHLGCG